MHILKCQYIYIVLGHSLASSSLALGNALVLYSIRPRPRCAIRRRRRRQWPQRRRWERRWSSRRRKRHRRLARVGSTDWPRASSRSSGRRKRRRRRWRLRRARRRPECLLPGRRGRSVCVGRRRRRRRLRRPPVDAPSSGLDCLLAVRVELRASGRCGREQADLAESLWRDTALEHANEC